MAVFLGNSTQYMNISYKFSNTLSLRVIIIIATDLNKWHFLSVTLIKFSKTNTKVCIYYNNDGIVCGASTYTWIFSDTGTNKIDLGYGFNGNHFSQFS